MANDFSDSGLHECYVEACRLRHSGAMSKDLFNAAHMWIRQSMVTANLAGSQDQMAQHLAMAYVDRILRDWEREGESAVSAPSQ